MSSWGSASPPDTATSVWQSKKAGNCDPYRHKIVYSETYSAALAHIRYAIQLGASGCGQPAGTAGGNAGIRPGHHFRWTHRHDQFSPAGPYPEQGPSPKAADFSQRGPDQILHPIHHQRRDYLFPHQPAGGEPHRSVHRSFRRGGQHHPGHHG